MAVYKVIQDIEAEDKLVGPLSFKGLVYAIITVACAFINFRLLFSGIPIFIKLPVVALLLIPMVLFGTLASPLGREQPTEVWLLARVRFFLKPRLRVWDQSGISQLIKVTAPKREIKQLTKNLSQTEVASRLQALATTLDSRGWAVKNVSVNLSSQPGYFDNLDSDRLVGTDDVVKEVPEVNIHAADDILDVKSNPTAQKFQNLMTQADIQRREALQARLEAARRREAEAEQDYSHKHQGHKEKIHDLRQARHLEDKSKSAMMLDRPPSETTRVTVDPQTDKLELAQSGNDLSVASIAKLANRNLGNEIVVALH